MEQAPDARRFPVHPDDRHLLRSVPWTLLDSHEGSAQRNHSQSLERLAERGGLSLSEIAAVIEDRQWRSMTDEEALVVVTAAVNKAEEEAR